MPPPPIEKISGPGVLGPAHRARHRIQSTRFALTRTEKHPIAAVAVTAAAPAVPVAVALPLLPRIRVGPAAGELQHRCRNRRPDSLDSDGCLEHGNRGSPDTGRQREDHNLNGAICHERDGVGFGSSARRRMTRDPHPPSQSRSSATRPSTHPTAATAPRSRGESARCPSRSAGPRQLRHST